MELPYYKIHNLSFWDFLCSLLFLESFFISPSYQSFQFISLLVFQSPVRLRNFFFLFQMVLKNTLFEFMLNNIWTLPFCSEFPPSSRNDCKFKLTLFHYLVDLKKKIPPDFQSVSLSVCQSIKICNSFLNRPWVPGLLSHNQRKTHNFFLVVGPLNGGGKPPESLSQKIKIWRNPSILASTAWITGCLRKIGFFQAKHFCVKMLIFVSTQELSGSLVLFFLTQNQCKKSGMLRIV